MSRFKGQNRTIELSVVNIRRSNGSVYGQSYFLVGLGIYVLFVLLLLTIGPTPQSASRALSSEGSVGATSVKQYVLITLVPFLLPLMTVISSTGVTYFISIDRTNGVYEYLMGSLKVRIRDIYFSFIIADLSFIALTLAIDVPVSLFVFYLVSGYIPSYFISLILIYSIPTAFLSSLLGVLAILNWSAMSKMYPGINAPGGIGTIVGFVGPVAFLLFDTVKGGGLLDSALFTGIMGCIFLIVLYISVKGVSNEKMLAS